MLESLEVRTASEHETILLGAAIGLVVAPGDVIFLVGDLGAGKTRLAKGIVSAATQLPPEDVVSPTFSLINQFDGVFPVHHADLYRLDADQIQGIGLEDALDDQGVLIVEWTEKIGDLCEDPLTIFIAYADENDSRRIVLEWSPNGSWGTRLGDLAETGWKK